MLGNPPCLLALALAIAGVAAREPMPGGIYKGGDHSGCGKAANTSSSSSSSLAHFVTSGGMQRNYTVHLPANYSPSQQYPVLVGYHGYPGKGLYLEIDSRLDDFAPDKIILYPDGVGMAWAGANYSHTTVPQDLQFTWDLLADVRARYCVDSARIYATGISNGGGFVGALACNDTVGGEFAAFAPVAGAYYTDAHGPNDGCKPARDLTPILEFHGGDDRNVFYDGGQGEGGYEPPIADWLSWWAERNGCQAPPEKMDSFNDTVHHLIWSCRDIKGVLQHYKVDTMKHDWPSTVPNFSQEAAGDVPTHINASAIMQDFFRNFTRPAAAAAADAGTTPPGTTSPAGRSRYLDSALMAAVGVITGDALFNHLM